MSLWFVYLYSTLRFQVSYTQKNICLQLHVCTPTNMAYPWRIVVTLRNGDISVPVLPSLVFDCKVVLMPIRDLPYWHTIRHCMLSFNFGNYLAAKTYGTFDRLVSFVRKGTSSKKSLNSLSTYIDNWITVIIYKFIWFEDSWIIFSFSVILAIHSAQAVEILERPEFIIVIFLNRMETNMELTPPPLVPHICVSELGSISSDNGLSPHRRQALVWVNAGILLIWPLGVNLTLGIRLQQHSHKNSKLFIHQNAFENVVWEMVAILSRGRWVTAIYCDAHIQSKTCITTFSAV